MGTHTIVRTEIHKAKSALNRQRISFAELTEDETIELYGHIWHKPEDEQKRIDHFQKFGYSTLVIWADELYKGRREDLITKLPSFHNSPSASII